MKRYLPRCFFASLLAALAACHSAPSRFFVLTAERPIAGLPTAPDARQGGIAVAFGRVSLPAALDRPQIARRVGPNRLAYSETERWAGPLDAMTRRVLADDLADRLPPGFMLVEGSSATPASRTIAVALSRFDADSAGRVTLIARWEVYTQGGALAGPPHDVTIIEPGSGSGDAPALAAAMSRALGGLAADIARLLR